MYSTHGNAGGQSIRWGYNSGDPSWTLYQNRELNNQRIAHFKSSLPQHVNIRLAQPGTCRVWSSS